MRSAQAPSKMRELFLAAALGWVGSFHLTMPPGVPLSSAASLSSDRRTCTSWWQAGIVILTIVLTYSGSLRSPFLFDDIGAVVNNATIRDLTSSAIWRPPTDGSTTTGRPVVNVSFAINYALSGESTWSYHAFNLAIHALAALMLLGIVRRTLLRTRRVQPAGMSRAVDIDGAATLAALLWALHPLQTESVISIAQRTESLCGLFYLLTLYAFIRSVDDEPPADRSEIGAPTGAPLRGTGVSDSGRRTRWLAISVLSCFFGMGTKEVMVTAPLLVLLYDRTFVAGRFGAALRRRSRYYASLATAWLVLVWLVIGSGGARGTAAGFGLGITSWDYLLTQASAIVRYVGLSVWPSRLTFDYGTATAHSFVDVWWQAALVISLLTASIWALLQRLPMGFLGVAFFLILAPSSSVVPLVTQTVAEHRMYLPLAAMTTLAAIAGFGFDKRAARFALVALAIALAWVTQGRIHDYRSAVAIWSDTVAKVPTNARAHNNLASALQQQGATKEANVHFARAVALDPNYFSARYNWGVALLDQGRVPEAIAQLESAVSLAPNHPDALVNLGTALVRAQRADEAIPRFETALRLSPNADVHYDLGIALLDTGRMDAATDHFTSALQLNARLPEAHYQLGRLAERAGRLVEAEEHYNATVRLAPNHAAAHSKLGLLLARTERLDAAAEHFRAVVRLQPNDADAHANLGNVLLLQSQPRAALASYEEALRLRPDDPRTRENIRLAREALH